MALKEKYAQHCSLQCLVEVSVVEDDQGVFAAQFKGDRFQAPRRDVGDVLADSGRTTKIDSGNVTV